MFSEDGSTYLCRISRQLFFQTVFNNFFDFCEFLSVFWFTQILVHFTGPVPSQYAKEKLFAKVIELFMEYKTVYFVSLYVVKRVAQNR